MEKYLDSSLGKKYLMALTGLVWAGFVVAHMAGNLLIFFGADSYNSYGHLLTSGKLIYIIECLLLFCLLTHVYCAISLTVANKKARGTSYAVLPSGPKGATLASRTMAAQGSLILVFVVSHILTFKYGPYYETVVDGVQMRDLYQILIEVFHQPIYVVWYLVSLFLLGIHLSHGMGSIFQSLGLLSRSSQSKIKILSWVYAGIVAAGFMSQPIFVYFFAK